MLLGLEITSAVLMGLGFLFLLASYRVPAKAGRERTEQDKKVTTAAWAMFGLGFLLIIAISVWG
jgi:hypothetical protein